jgi:hypothetical protein
MDAQVDSSDGTREGKLPSPRARRRLTIVIVVAGAALLAVSYYLKSFGTMLLGAALLASTLALGGALWSSAALTAISMLLGLAGLEFALGLMQGSAWMGQQYFMLDDASLGYVAQPGKHNARKLTRAGDVVYDVIYSIDGDGFRVTPQAEGTRTSAAYFLGCSYTFGEGLFDDETLPYYFGSLNPEVRVKNFGMHGYGLSHSLVVLEDRVPEKGVLVLVLTSPWHAFRIGCVEPWLKGSPRFVLGSGGRLERAGACDPLIHRLDSASVVRHSHIYRGLTPLVKRYLESAPGLGDLYLAVLKRLKAVTDERGQRLVVAYMRMSQADSTELAVSNDEMIARIKGEGIELVDVTLAPEAKYSLSPHDRHPSAAANRRRAEILTGYVRGTRR